MHHRVPVCIVNGLQQLGWSSSWTSESVQLMPCSVPALREVMNFDLNPFIVFFSSFTFSVTAEELNQVLVYLHPVDFLLLLHSVDVTVEFCFCVLNYCEYIYLYSEVVGEKTHL